MNKNNIPRKNKIRLGEDGEPTQEKEMHRQNRPLTASEKLYASKMADAAVDNWTDGRQMKIFFMHVTEDIMNEYINDKFSIREKLYIWSSLMKVFGPNKIDVNLKADQNATDIISNLINSVAETPPRINEPSMKMPDNFKNMVRDTNVPTILDDPKLDFLTR